MGEGEPAGPALGRDRAVGRGGGGKGEFMIDKQYVINEIAASESWRMFHIIAEFVEGFEALGKYHPTVSIFGSTRAKPGDEVYQKAEQIGRLLAEHGVGV